jgi:hypothetical protein
MKSDQLIFYTTPNGDVKLELNIQDETLWLSQSMMAELFGVKEHTITYHLKEIFESGELIEQATTRKIRVVRNEGKRKVSREIIFEKADKSKPFMGLSTWKNAPKGRILSSDVTQAKQHLQCRFQNH